MVRSFAHYAAEICLTISVDSCSGSQLVVYQIQFLKSQRLPRRSGRSNFLSNKSHIINRSSPSTNTTAVFLSILLFKFLLLALSHLTEHTDINQSYLMSCYRCPTKDRQCSMKSIGKRGYVCKSTAYAPWAHTRSLHSVSNLTTAMLVRFALQANLCCQLFYQEIIMTD